jgi:hypothetical protein
LLESKFSKYSIMIIWIALIFVMISPFRSLILLILVFLLHLLVSFSPWFFETGSHFVAQAGLEPAIL